MYDIEKAQRSNRIVLAIACVLLIVALSLVAFGHRGLAGWAVLASSVGNLMLALVGRRALNRLRAASTGKTSC
jgi:hypothetical protein